MIWPPGSLLLPPPAFHAWIISGEVLWVGPSCLMHYPVPYIPPPPVPAGGLDQGRPLLSCLGASTQTVCQVKHSRGGFSISLHDTVDGPSACVELSCAEHLALPQQNQAPCWDGRARRKRAALGNQTQLRVPAFRTLAARSYRGTPRDA